MLRKLFSADIHYYFSDL